MAILASVSELQNVTVDERGAAVVITLNRPEKRNALSLALMQELCGVLEAVESSSEVRVVVLEGAGA
ncbi:MAG: enoyl-CoA hydratase-related protein, partial [Solirubrobacteraceae bacterium]